MSYRQGTRLIAGAGATPYIDPNTGNWAICGIDTGVQAVQTKVSIDEYNNMVKSGTIDQNKMYFITNVSPTVYTDKRISASGWIQVSENRYTNTLALSGVTTTDTIMVDVAASLSDDDYMVAKEAVNTAGIQRIRSSDGFVIIVASSPMNIDLLVDITVTKCIVGE